MAPYQEHPIEVMEALEVEVAEAEEVATCYVCMDVTVEEEGDMCDRCGRDQHMEFCFDARRKYDE